MAMKWPLMLLAVIGAFFTAGLVGGLIAAHMGLWDVPAAGFCAAFAVVVVTYLAAPHHKMRSALLAFCMGAVVAWYLLEPSFYPEFPAQYHEVAYARTHFPLIATCLGGILGLVVGGGAWRRTESGRLMNGQP